MKGGEYEHSAFSVDSKYHVLLKVVQLEGAVHSQPTGFSLGPWSFPALCGLPLLCRHLPYRCNMKCLLAKEDTGSSLEGQQHRQGWTSRTEGRRQVLSETAEGMRPGPGLQAFLSRSSGDR